MLSSKKVFLNKLVNISAIIIQLLRKGNCARHFFFDRVHNTQGLLHGKLSWWNKFFFPHCLKLMYLVSWRYLFQKFEFFLVVTCFGNTLHIYSALYIYIYIYIYINYISAKNKKYIYIYNSGFTLAWFASWFVFLRITLSNLWWNFCRSNFLFVYSFIFRKTMKFLFTLQAQRFIYI